jgi:hypothetical protein
MRLNLNTDEKLLLRGRDLLDLGILQAATEAIRSGNVAAARSYLVQYLSNRPNDETAWWLLSVCAEYEHQRHYCLKRVMSLGQARLEGPQRKYMLDQSPPEYIQPAGESSTAESDADPEEETLPEFEQTVVEESSFEASSASDNEILPEALAEQVEDSAMENLEMMEAQPTGEPSEDAEEELSAETEFSQAVGEDYSSELSMSAVNEMEPDLATTARFDRHVPQERVVQRKPFPYLKVGLITLGVLAVVIAALIIVPPLLARVEAGLLPTETVSAAVLVEAATDTPQVEPTFTLEPTLAPEPTAEPTVEVAANLPSLQTASLPEGMNLVVSLSHRSQRGVDERSGLFSIDGGQRALQILLDDGMDLQGSAPDGKRLLINQARNLYVYNMADGSQTLLSDRFITPCMPYYLLPDTCVNATWLPGTEQVAFLGLEGDQAKIFVVDADGQNTRSITQAIDQPRGIYPYANATKVYWKSVSASVSDVWFSMNDGVLPAANQVFSKTNITDEMTALYGTKELEAGELTFSYSYEVRWTSVSGGESQPTFNEMQSPVFTPDGKSFAFYNHLGVFSAPIDQSGYSYLDYQYNFDTMALSPDGRKLFVATNGKNLLVKNTINNKVQELPLSTTNVRKAVWSPNSDYLLLVSFAPLQDQNSVWHTHELLLFKLEDESITRLGPIGLPSSPPFFVENVVWVAK